MSIISNTWFTIELWLKANIWIPEFLYSFYPVFVFLASIMILFTTGVTMTGIGFWVCSIIATMLIVWSLIVIFMRFCQ